MKTKTIILLLSVCIGLTACKSAEEKEDKQETKNNTEETGFVIDRGLNVSHWLSQTEIRGEEREAYMQEKDFKKIAELGFDHVRIPFDEVHLWDEDGNRHEDAFTLLHKGIKHSLTQGMRVILDFHILRSHYFNDEDILLWKDTTEQEKFWNFWKELSAEFRKYSTDSLAYELLNEAKADDPEKWNKLIAKGIETVRENEPERVIIVGSNRWQQVHTFKDLKVPKNDKNIILSFHYYEPFLLSHYKTPWSPVLKDFHGEISYPGMTVDTLQYKQLDEKTVGRIKQNNAVFNKEKFEEYILKAVNVAKEYGLPLYCGEFGCYPTTDIELRAKVYNDWIDVFQKYNIAWTHWNYKNDFPVVNPETLEPVSEIMNILMK
jgi:endoglucanase